MTKNERLAKILKDANINATNARVIGSFAHIDTFKKYENALSDLMANAGFKFHSKRDGVHLDNYVGFRMVFIAQ